MFNQKQNRFTIRVSFMLTDTAKGTIESAIVTHKNTLIETPGSGGFGKRAAWIGSLQPQSDPRL